MANIEHDYRCITHGLVGEPRCPIVITFEGDCNYGDPCNRICQPVMIVPTDTYRGAVEAFARERQDVLNCVNLYGDETLHKALDGIGWPDDYIGGQ